jgi:hypothetical protein
MRQVAGAAESRISKLFNPLFQGIIPGAYKAVDINNTL